MVQDASGAVLPGVTVEATSPALIEKMRAAVTDGSGRYSIVDLRPGTYEVSFSLAGFSTIKREGVVLSGNFDAPVNAELRVGSLEETITVSGASPVVDVTNTLTQTVLTKEQIEVLPGGRTIQGRAALVPGVMVTSANTGVIAHGSASTDSHTMIDGYKSGMHLVGRGTGRLGVGSVTQTQEATIEELVYDAAGQGAEYAFSGVRMNMIPKEGSNATRFETISYGSRETFETNNLGDLQDPPYNFQYAPQEFFFDFNSVVGGPLKRDKLWYFASIAGNRSNTRILDTYFKPVRALDAGEVSGPARGRSNAVVPGRHRRQVESVGNGPGHAPGHQQAQAALQLRQHAHRQPARQLHDRGREAFARGGVAPAALPDLVRAGAMDGADHEPPAARGRLFVSARRLSRELPARESD